MITASSFTFLAMGAFFGLTVVLYFLLFYFMLVGSKISIAYLVEKSKTFLTNKAYTLTMQIPGIVLFVFAVLFIIDGIKMLRDIAF